MSTDQHCTIAFFGLGSMGGPMAVRLLEAGHEVIGVDPAPVASDRFVSAGGSLAHGAESAVKRCTTVILMLPDSNTVETVLTDKTVFDALTPNTVVVDMGSSNPLRTRRLADTLLTRHVHLIDAPVSGGVRGAIDGSLTVMVGGDDPTVAEAQPLLELFGSVNHVGPVGAGHVVKALNNLLSATHLLATSEAVQIGRAIGLDEATMIAAFNASSGRSGSTENKWPNFVLTGTFDSGFALRLMLKDIQIAVDVAEGVGHPTSLGDCVARSWQAAANDLPPDADHTQIAAWIAGLPVSPPTS